MEPACSPVSPKTAPAVESRPRLLVLNQYYDPGVEATGQLLSQLCTGLARDFDVTVVTGRLGVPGGEPGDDRLDGVAVARVRSTAFPRRRLSLRGLNYLTYLAAALRTAVTLPRPDLVLCMTDPPVLANVALLVARRFRVPLVVVTQDVFPEIAVRLRRLDNRLLVGALRLAVRRYLERGERIIAIGELMRARLEQKGAPSERVHVIPNWADTDLLREQPRDNAWAREFGLHDRFVVMHSGNIGYAQDLDTLVRAATFLRDVDDLAVAIVGDGARRAQLVALAQLLEADQVRFLPYQRRDVLPRSLSSADVHVVGLARGLSGYVVPSRLYGVLAVGRPVIVAADEDSEPARLVAGIGCGIVVPPGRPELLAAAIRRFHDGEYDLEAMSVRGREYARAEGGRDVAVGRYRALLGELVENGRRPSR